MIKIGDIKKLIECAVLTGYIKNKANVVSLFLIAQAESGKSELIKTARDYSNTYYTNDLSIKPFINSLIPKLSSDTISHILIPDFINILSHKRASESLTPVLNSIMSEGLKDLKFYGIETSYEKEVKGGLITGVTKKYFDKRITTWRDIGFPSRMIPLTFNYSKSTQIEIHNFIRQEKHLTSEKITKNFEKQDLNSFIVKIPNTIADGIQLLTLNLKEQNKHYVLFKENRKWDLQLERYGFRLHQQLRTLLQGIALYNNKTLKKEITATRKDLEDLMELSKFMNFYFTEI